MRVRDPLESVVGERAGLVAWRGMAGRALITLRRYASTPCCTAPASTPACWAIPQTGCAQWVLRKGVVFQAWRFFASKTRRNAGEFGREGRGVPPFTVVAATSCSHLESLMSEAKAKPGGLALVHFTARSRRSCRLMSRVVNYLSTQYNDITFLKVDLDKAELCRAGDAAGIRDVPTFQFYKKGKVVAQMTGAVPAKLKEMMACSWFYAKYRKK